MIIPSAYADGTDAARQGVVLLMKSCPKCKRTYADDGITFCLEDGALLSPPYDLEEATILAGREPPPTVAMDDNAHEQKKAVKLQPTIAAPPPPLAAGVPALDSAQQAEPEVAKKSRLPLVLAALTGFLLLVAGIAVTSLWTRCPVIRVTCSQLQENEAHCELRMEDGRPAFLHHGITATWSTSAGTMFPGRDLANIDTTGLSGKEITITATFSGAGIFCSNSASTSFIAR